MNRTLGYTLIIGALAGAAYTGASWWLGKQIETEYNQKIDQFAKEYEADFTVVDRQYERGIFSARATLTLMVEVPEEPAEEECGECEGTDPGTDEEALPEAGADSESGADMISPAVATAGEDIAAGAADAANEAAATDQADTSEAETGTEDEDTESGSTDGPLYRTIRIPLVNDIRHGPLAGGSPALAAITTRMGQIKGFELDESMKKAMASLKPPTATTIVDFDRTTHGRIVMPAAGITNPNADGASAADENYLMRWQDLRFDFRVTQGETPLHGELHWPAFSARIPLPNSPVSMIAIDMKNWRSRFDSALPDANSLFAVGTTRDEFDSLQIRVTPAGESDLVNLISLDKPSIDTRITQNGGRASLEGSLESTGTLGSASMEKFSMKTTLANLDQPAVLSLMELSGEPEMTEPADDPDADPAPDPYDQPLRQLFGARPELRVSINATIGGETGGLNHAVRLLPLPPQLPGNPASMGINTSIDADASLKLPKSWPALLNPPAQPSADNPEAEPGNLLEDGIRWAAEQGALKEEGKHWSATASVQRGKITVNGMPSGQL